MSSHSSINFDHGILTEKLAEKEVSDFAKGGVEEFITMSQQVFDFPKGKERLRWLSISRSPGSACFMDDLQNVTNRVALALCDELLKQEGVSLTIHRDFPRRILVRVSSRFSDNRFALGIFTLCISSQPDGGYVYVSFGWDEIPMKARFFHSIRMFFLSFLARS